MAALPPRPQTGTDLLRWGQAAHDWMRSNEITGGVNKTPIGTTLPIQPRTRGYRGPFWGGITDSKEVSVHDGYFVIGEINDNPDSDPETIDTTSGSYSDQTVYIFLQIKYTSGISGSTLVYDFDHNSGRPNVGGDQHPVTRIDNLVFYAMIGTCEADASGNLSGWKQEQYGHIGFDKYEGMFSAQIAGASENQILIQTGRVYWGASHSDLTDTLTIPTGGGKNGVGHIYIKLELSSGSVTATLEIEDTSEHAGSFPITGSDEVAIKLVGRYIANETTGEVLSWEQYQRGSWNTNVWSWYDPTLNDTDSRIGFASPEMVLIGTTANVDTDANPLLEFKGGQYMSSS